MINETKTIEIYVQLLGDEEGTLRQTQALSLGGSMYKVLPIPNYEIADEQWKFIPGTIVKCELRNYRGQDYLLAVEQVK